MSADARAACPTSRVREAIATAPCWMSDAGRAACPGAQVRYAARPGPGPAGRTSREDRWLGSTAADPAPRH